VGAALPPALPRAAIFRADARTASAVTWVVGTTMSRPQFGQ